MRYKPSVPKYKMNIDKRQRGNNLADKYLSRTTFKHYKNKGFTLIELIVGIVVFAISLSIIIQFIGPTERNSADQIHQIKASQLAQSLMDDIMSRAFDEQSDHIDGSYRCNDDVDGVPGFQPPERICTNLNSLGPDNGEVSRADFDDVDDFHNYTVTFNADGTPVDTLENFDRTYEQFDVVVEVTQVRDPDIQTFGRSVKQITITVTTPLETEITFTVFRVNY